MDESTRQDQEQADQPQKLTEIMDQAVEETEEDEEVSLGEVLDSFGARTYGPMILVPALIAAMPLIGGIPGISIVTGSIIFLIAVQILFLKDRPWIPKKLRDMSFSHDKLEKAVKKTKPWVKPMQKLIHRRLTFLTEPPFLQITAVMFILLSVLFFPAALLPFAVLVPALAVILFALGLTSRDGVLILIGYVITGVSIWLVIHFWDRIREAWPF